MRRPGYPSLYQINARVYLSELAAASGRPATLDDVEDKSIAEWAESGFDLIYLLGVWQTGPASRHISESIPALMDEYRRLLDDFVAADISGSCFAVQNYTTDVGLGGEEALDRLRKRLHKHGLRLILDFVPNHTAIDHPWVQRHPEYYVHGNQERLAAEPQNYFRLKGEGEERILAYGRDPNYPGWSDTLQLNYGNPALQKAMSDELRKVARLCDGVRCDMAMLLLPDVFERTWGIRPEPFWPPTIESIHKEMKDFLFLAEVYWDLEWTLQQQGFDYTYDKRLYDRLREGNTHSIRKHLEAGIDFQQRLARFLENHDEMRAAAAFSPEVHQAAAVVTYLAPGMRFFHHGQLHGRKIRIPVQLRRGPDEPLDRAIAGFYQKLLRCMRDRSFREGHWHQMECRSAWESNVSSDDFIAYSWANSRGRKRMVVVNFSCHPSEGHIQIPWEEFQGKTWVFRDLMGTAVYKGDGRDLNEKGLHLSMPAWAYHVFEVYEAQN